MVAACAKLPALYRPHDPRASDLWRLIDEHFDTFQQVYDERYQAKYGFWRPVIEHSVAAFLKCGDLQEGFARDAMPRLPPTTMQAWCPVRRIFMQATDHRCATVPDLPLMPPEAHVVDWPPSTIAPLWCPPKMFVLQSRIGK